jgi:hypothetical protein
MQLTSLRNSREGFVRRNQMTLTNELGKRCRSQSIS